MTTVPPITDEDRISPNGRHPHIDTSWNPVDLTDAVHGTDVPGPDILQRIDGVSLVYRRRTHWFQAESEQLKSWLAQYAVAQVINDDEDVLYIDYEDNEHGVIPRLLALGLHPDALLDRLVYITPDEPLFDHKGKATPGCVAFDQLIADRAFGLVIIDGVTEALTTEGLDLLSNADIAVWLRRLPKRLASTGAAVICIDHVTKSTEGRGRYAIGGVHKLNAVTGATYSFNLLRPFSRAKGLDPVVGSVLVSVEKDRPGHIRGFAVDKKVAVFELTSYPDGTVAAALLGPDQEAPPDLALCLRILKYLDDYPASSKNRLETDVVGNDHAIREAISWMRAPGRAWIEVEVKGRSHLHSLTDAGREELP